ncbi:MAG: hypothetical protein HG439_000525 [candidate division SR1 bacterium]|nr:hypothetical protein [candidate division SR1 bacterium]
MTNRDSGKEIQLNAKDKLKWSQQKFDINSTVDTVFSAQKYTIPEKKEITLLVQKLVNQKFDVSKLADFLRKVEQKKNPLKALEKFVNEFLKQVVEKEDIQAKQPKITVKMKKERESQIRGIEATTQQNNKEATAKQKEVTDKQKEIEKIKEYNKTLKRLRDSYKNLPPQFKTHTPEEVQSKLSSLTPETRQAVQSSGMKLEEYVSMLLAKDALKGTTSPEAKEFKHALESFNKECGIIEHTAHGLPKSETPEASFLEENPDIKEYARDSKNKAFENPEHSKLLSDGEWLIDSKLTMFFGNDNLKKLTEEVGYFQNLPIDSWTSEQKQKKQIFDSKVKEIKAGLSENLLQIQKDTATNFPYTMLMNFFDEPTLRGETLDDQLSPNGKTRKMLDVEHGNSTEERVMKMSGKMNDAAIDIFYPMDTPNQTLQATDTMYYNRNLNRVVFGQKVDLNTEAPVISEVYAEINKELTPEKISGILKNSSSPAEFRKKFVEYIQNIVRGFLNASEEQEKYRLTRMAEKNQTKETLISTLFPGSSNERTRFEMNINQNPELKNFFMLCSATFESATSIQLQKFRSGLQKFNTLIKDRDALEKIADPILGGSLIKLHNFIIEKKTESSDFFATLTTFFNLFTRQNLRSPSLDPTSSDFKLNINDFSATLHHLSSGLPLDQNGQLSSFSQDFRNNYEAQKSSQSEHSTADIEADLELAYG